MHRERTSAVRLACILVASCAGSTLFVSQPLLAQTAPGQAPKESTQPYPVMQPRYMHKPPQYHQMKDGGDFGLDAWRMEDHEVRIRNRGTAVIQFAMRSGDKTCENRRVLPGAEIAFVPCGETMVWHDGHAYQTRGLELGKEYEISWRLGSWVVSLVE